MIYVLYSSKSHRPDRQHDLPGFNCRPPRPQIGTGLGNAHDMLISFDPSQWMLAKAPIKTQVGSTRDNRWIDTSQEAQWSHWSDACKSDPLAESAPLIDVGVIGSANSSGPPRPQRVRSLLLIIPHNELSCGVRSAHSWTIDVVGDLRGRTRSGSSAD